MAASMEGYESWLTEKLLSANPDTDTDVFVSYITGILEEESPEDEKKESILDLLGQVVVRMEKNLTLSSISFVPYVRTTYATAGFQTCMWSFLGLK